MKIVILGAGPSGLTAAWELLKLGKDSPSDIIVVEETSVFGGIAATRTYRDYRFDIGGHRFFSANADIRLLWKEILGTDMLTCSRLSRIFYKGRLFHYPLRPRDMLSALSPLEKLSFPLSYAAAQVFRRPERSFEDWSRNHFGRKLYEAFFKGYTEKVWGLPCDRISADWAAQRIKGVSLLSALSHAAGRDVRAKSLIRNFEYPVLGAGMFWERMAAILETRGVRFMLGRRAENIFHDGQKLTAVKLVSSGKVEEVLEADAFLSSIPLGELVRGFEPEACTSALAAARSLRYRDFIVVALIVDQQEVFPDNWIYVQSPDVRVGRIQNFKNWSAAMVPEKSKSCLGMEYFCSEGDRLWNTSDSGLIELAGGELSGLGLVERTRIREGVVIKVKKAYPVYTLEYKEQVAAIRRFLSRFGNLQIMGRNGLHRYNNQDHSMMTAMLAARNVHGGSYDVFKVNGDAGYSG